MIDGWTTRFQSLAVSADLYVACKHIVDCMETNRVPHPDDLQLLQTTLDKMQEQS